MIHLGKVKANNLEKENFDAGKQGLSFKDKKSHKE
jgi:hypothetical protein